MTYLLIHCLVLPHMSFCSCSGSVCTIPWWNFNAVAEMLYLFHLAVIVENIIMGVVICEIFLYFILTFWCTRLFLYTETPPACELLELWLPYLAWRDPLPPGQFSDQDPDEGWCAEPGNVYCAAQHWPGLRHRLPGDVLHWHVGWAGG